MSRSRSLGLFALAVVACTPEKPPSVPAKPAVGPAVVAEATPPVARWALLDRPKTTRPFGKGAIAVGELGERWWVEGATQKHADTFAPAPLVDSVEVADGKGKLAFVAADGSVLVAEEPLGPFGARHTPPAPLHAVAVGKTAICERQGAPVASRCPPPTHVAGWGVDDRSQSGIRRRRVRSSGEA